MTKLEQLKLFPLTLCTALVACLGIYEGVYALTDGHSFVRAFYGERQAPLDRDGLTDEIARLG